MAAVQAQHPTATVELWAEDEARLGLKPILRRVWSPRGQRPIAVVKPRYEWSYVYAFVQPQTGATEWWLVPTVRTSVMSQVLAAFAQAVGAGPTKRIVIVWDQAGWHGSKALVIPEGIHLVALPAHTPELQPAERLWPVLREAVANHTPDTLEALEEQLGERCRTLAEDPAQIKALTHYHWWPTA